MNPAGSCTTGKDTAPSLMKKNEDFVQGSKGQGTQETQKWLDLRDAREKHKREGEPASLCFSNVFPTGGGGGGWPHHQMAGDHRPLHIPYN